MRKKEIIESLGLLKKQYNEVSVRESERTKKLNKEISELRKKVWQLENPFKFNLGDEVKVNQNNGLQIVYFEADDNRKKNETTYKIVEREYQLASSNYYPLYSSHKVYTLFNCETFDKRHEYENNIELYTKKEKIKDK